MSRFFVFLCVICGVIGRRSLFHEPATIDIETIKEVDSSSLLKTTLLYASSDELSALNDVSDECLTTQSSRYNVSEWKGLMDLPDWKQYFEQYEKYAYQQCVALELESSDCLTECVYYNNILMWIPLIIANDSLSQYELQRMISLYSMSAGPVSYQDVGNPDMCIFSAGTYCYTPAMSGGWPIMQHACCLPGTCQGDDAQKVLTANNWCYKGFETFISSYGADEVLTICEPMERELDSVGPLIVIVIFVIFFLLIVFASIFKRFCMEYANKEAQEIVNRNTFISSFNIQDIWTTFRSVRPVDKSQLNFLDGIRVWSMTWVILGHSFMYYFLSASSNMATFAGDRTDYTYLVQKFYTIFIQYAFYSVDTFFFLSGLLATFSIYRSLTKFGDKTISLFYQWIPMSYLMRFLRITPMMMFVTAINWQLSDQLPYGYHVTSRTTYNEYCNDQWYKILFYYANLTLTHESSEALQCMGHLWYIQCDMQMFLLLPWILLLFTYNKLWGLLASCVPTLVCLIIRFYYAFYYDFVANTIVTSYPPQHDGVQDVDSYYQPWTRMSVYFIGVSTMLLMILINEKYKDLNKKFTINKLTYFGLIFLSSFILLALVIWPFQDVEDEPSNRWSLLSNQFYYALGRPSWGFGLALLTFALYYMNEDVESSGNGQKSLIKEFLSCEIYQSLGKLTYCMYLLHLIVFGWWSMDLELPSYYNEWNELLLIIGVWFITASISLILWFIMEKPIANLTTAFTKCITNPGNKRRNKRLSEQQQQLLFADHDNNNNNPNVDDHDLSSYVAMNKTNYNKLSVNNPNTDGREGSLSVDEE